MPVSYRSWSRAELEAEARRQGVEEPWLLSRSQLVARLGGEEERLRDLAARTAGRLVLGAVDRLVDRLPGLLGGQARPPLPQGGERDATGARPPFARPPASRWLEPLVSRARAAVFGPAVPPPRPSPFPPPAPRAASEPPRAATPPPPTVPPPASPFPPPSSPPPAPRPSAGNETPAVTRTARTSGPPSTVGGEAARPDGAADALPSAPLAPAGTATDAPEPSPVPDPDTPPIESLTLARLLARQGREDRALRMLAALLEKNPGDTGLRRDALALEAELGGPLRVVRSADTVEVAWRLPLDGARHARDLAGGDDASLVLRTVVIARDPSAIVRSRTIDEPLSARRGDARVTGVPADARTTVSLGWRGPARFVSIAHLEAAPPRA